MDLAAIAAAISAACSVIQTVVEARAVIGGVPAEPRQFAKPVGLAISDDDFVKLMLSLRNTYSDRELEAIRGRLEACRRNFEETLDGKARQLCICSVLRSVAEGNGGRLPDVDGWNETFDLLCAA